MVAEFAVALPAVVLVLALLLGAARVALAQVGCVDAARAGARAAARGEGGGGGGGGPPRPPPPRGGGRPAGLVRARVGVVLDV